MFAGFRLWIANGLRAFAEFIHEEQFDPEEFEKALADLEALTSSFTDDTEEPPKE